jgi:hypothetical protein
MNNDNSAGIISRSTISITSPYVYYPMHDAAGVTDITGSTNISGLATTHAVQGTTTNIYTTNPGHFTSAGGNYIQDVSDEMFTFATQTPGTILYALGAIQVASTPGTNMILFSYGHNQTTTGGWALQYNTSDKLQVITRQDDDTGAITGAPTAITAATHIPFVAYWDWSSETHGVFAETAANTASASTGTSSDVRQDYGFAIGGTVTDGPVHADDWLATHRFSDLLFIKKTGSTNYAAALMTEWVKGTREFFWTLDGF